MNRVPDCQGALPKWDPVHFSCYNALTMTTSRRMPPGVLGVLAVALPLIGVATAEAPAATESTIPVRLVVCVENIDHGAHPIRIAIDGQPVFRRTVRGPTLINWPFFGGRSRRQTVRLSAGEHRLALEEDITHVIQQTQITVTRPCEVRVGFWPWYQDGRFRQEPHFTVTMHPQASSGAS